MNQKTYPSTCPYCYPENPARDVSIIREAHAMGFVVHNNDYAEAIHEHYHPPPPRRYRLLAWVHHYAHNLKASARILRHLDPSIVTPEASRDREVYAVMQKFFEQRSCTGRGMVLSGKTGSNVETAPYGIFVDFSDPWGAVRCRDCDSLIVDNIDLLLKYASAKHTEGKRRCIQCEAYRVSIPAELAIRDIVSSAAKHMRQYTALMLKCGERYSDDEIIRGCASTIWGYPEIFGWLKWSDITARFVAAESLARAVVIHRELVEARKLGRLDQLEAEWDLEEEIAA